MFTATIWFTRLSCKQGEEERGSLKTQCAEELGNRNVLSFLSHYSIGRSRRGGFVMDELPSPVGFGWAGTHVQAGRRRALPPDWVICITLGGVYFSSHTCPSPEFSTKGRSLPIPLCNPAPTVYTSYVLFLERTLQKCRHSHSNITSKLAPSLVRSL
jgi:hypothetical protein